MSFESKAGEFGRQPLKVVELHLDSCSLVYGVGACTATGSPGQECYNTRPTCQVASAFSKVSKVYRFTEQNVHQPAELDAYPCLVDVSFAPTTITPGEGIGARASVTIQLQDFTDSDRGVDPYVENRDYDPSEQGTFFGRLKVRNAFYPGRPLLVKECYIDDPFTFDHSKTRHYVIDTISGPDKRGRVTIVAKDILKLADGDKAQCPAVSTGTLQAAIDMDDSILTFESNAVAVQYKNTDPNVRIGDEIITLGAVSGSTIIGCLRGRHGTVPVAHDIGDSVQSCKTITDQGVADVAEDLLVNFAKTPASYIPSADWQAEQSEYLAGVSLNRVISEPTSVVGLLNELADECQCAIFWDEVEQEVKFSAASPWVEDGLELNDDDHLIGDSIKVTDRHDLRVTQVWFYFGVRSATEDGDEAKNYHAVYVQVDSEREGANQFDGSVVKKVYSKWFDAASLSDVQVLVARHIERFADTPIEAEFELDAKDAYSVRTGDVIRLNTRMIQGFSGANEVTRAQVIESEPEESGSRYRYKVLKYQGVPKNELVITGTRTSVNIWDELSRPTVPINVGVVIDAFITGRPALTDEGIHTDSTLEVSFVNGAIVAGDGGVGGAGAAILADYVTREWFIVAGDGGDGEDGADGVVKTCNWSIDISDGFLFGGGAGAGGDASGGSVKFGIIRAGKGGDAGQGYNDPTGGAGGKAQRTSPDDFSETFEADGANGSASGPGLPGGGAWGEDGEDGTGDTVQGWSSTPEQYSGGRGGRGGYAVRDLNGSLSWTGMSATRVKGAIGS